MNKDHIQLSIQDVPETVLLPGDPGRVDEIGECLDDVRLVGSNREFRTIVGSYGSVPLAVCSTGIGGPSTEIALIELFKKGAQRFLRIGTSGALQPHINVGDLIISTGSIRQSGTAASYVPDAYPALANHEMVLALIQAAEELAYPYHVGLGLSVDCFYATKPDLVREQPMPSQIVGLVAEYVKAGALHLEMEAATVMVLAGILGAASAAVCTVGSNQITKIRPPEAPTNERAIRVACRAAMIVEEWNEAKRASKAAFFYPNLLKGR